MFAVVWAVEGVAAVAELAALEGVVALEGSMGGVVAVRGWLLIVPVLIAVG